MITQAFSPDLAAERRRDLIAAADAYRRRAAATQGPRRASWWQLRVRPVRPSDEKLVAAVFAGLGPESRQSRYLFPKAELDVGEIRALTRDDSGTNTVLVAVSRWRGRPVGIANFVRDPIDPTTAEIAVAVCDRWQGRGVGRLLAGRLAERAQRQGIATFTAVTVHGNIRARRVLVGLGELQAVDRDGTTVSYRVHLPGAAPTRGSTVSTRPNVVRQWFVRAHLGPANNYVTR